MKTKQTSLFDLTRGQNYGESGCYIWSNYSHRLVSIEELFDYNSNDEEE